MQRSLSASPVWIVSLLLILSTLVGTCEAQNGSSFFFLPLVLFFVIAAVMCFVFWGCVCGIAWFSKNSRARVSSQTVQYTYNARQSNQGIYPRSQVGSAYPVQSHYPQSSVPYPPSTRQTVTEAQPVSLPEATLHQGDAPPGYEEAIRMKTVSDT